MKKLFAIAILSLWSTAVIASVNVTVNGTTYSIPQTNEKGWGASVTSWIQAVSSSTIQPNSGTFTLTADLDFGGSYGLKSLYYKSRSSNLASSGMFRLANTDTFCWRNAANAANVCLSPNVSTDGVLQYNGVDLLGSSLTQTITNKTIAAGSNTITGLADANVASGAAIARSKLASGTASHVVINDGSGVLSSEAQLSPGRGGSGVNNSGTFTWGSNNITVTTGGATSVTLPASGTLATQAGSETLTNKTISGASNTISNINLGSQVTSTLPIGNGGTGQTTANSALNALLPSQSSANGKVLGSNGTDSSWISQNSGTVTSVAQTVPNFLSISGSPVTTSGTLAITGLTPATAASGFTLSSSNFYVTMTGMASNQTVTLPTAIGAAGTEFFIVNGETSANGWTVTINTTSAQTIGGRASGSIVLQAIVGDFLHVKSDNSNWVIMGKKETSNYAGAGSTTLASGQTNIFTTGAGITIPKGFWRVWGYLNITQDAASAADYATIGGGTGFYSANGNATTTTPTSLATNFTEFTNMQSLAVWSSGSGQFGGTASYGGNNVYVMGPVSVYTSASNSLYFVPKLNTVGSAIHIYTNIAAERVW